MKVVVVGTQCGISKSAPNSARIVGGDEAKPHSWPWMVLISCTMFNEQGYGITTRDFGGTIISAEWIITAAHSL